MSRGTVFCNDHWASNILRGITLASVLLLVAACGSSDLPPPFPVRQWEDIRVEIESRPPRLTPGMNEFLVIATRPPRKPAHDLIVSLRINDQGKWHQAIQDGHVGVYRRAILVPDPDNDVLAVRLQRDEREGVLYFPLRQQEAAPSL